jgi:DNA-binding XRE family transcriptional regulator
MPVTTPTTIAYESVVLNGVRYAILPEARLLELCRQVGTQPATGAGAAPPPADLDEFAQTHAALGRRLVQRRRRAGMTQVELARRAGVRVETLNRIERGKTEPDFATVRKLVAAMNAAEVSINAEGMTANATGITAESTPARNAPETA